MIDMAKIADIAIILIDASIGFEMETFEFLSLLRVINLYTSHIKFHPFNQFQHNIYETFFLIHRVMDSQV